MRIFKVIAQLAVVATVAIASTSCSNNKEVAAYEKAKALYQSGNYNEATLYIDSIKIHNPNGFDYIRAGMQLERKIKVAQNQEIIKNISDSLPIYTAEHDKLLTKFNYTKNEKYQDKGTLVYKGLKDSDLQTKSQIRVDVTEVGDLRLLSVYRGAKKLNHTAIKLSTANGDYAMSNSVAYDGASNYRYSVDGSNIETITYQELHIWNLADFVANNSDKKITVSYEGSFPYSYILDKGTKDAIVNSYNMAKVIKRINILKRDDCIASRGIVVLEKQINEHKNDSI